MTSGDIDSIAVDSTGSVVLAGAVTSGTHFDALVTKVNGQGQGVFSRAIGQGGYSRGLHVGIGASDAIYLAGPLGGAASISAPPVFLQTSAMQTTFVLALDANGGGLWGRMPSIPPGSITDFPHAFAVDATGRSVLTGMGGGGQVDWGCGSPQGMYLADLGPTGSCVYEIGTSAEATDVGIGSQGQVIVLGYPCVLEALDAQGNAVWQKTFAGSGRAGFFVTPYESRVIDVGPAGDFAVALSVPPSADFGGGPVGAAGLAIVKFDSAGSFLWNKVFPTSATTQQWVSDISVSAQGSVLVSGMGDGTLDFGGGPIGPPGSTAFVFELDATGAHRFSYGAPTSNLPFVRVGFDSTGAAFVYGHPGGPALFGCGIPGANLFKLGP